MRNLSARLRMGLLSTAFAAVSLFAAAGAAAQPPAGVGRAKTERLNGREVAAAQVIVKFKGSAAPQAAEHAKAAADVESDRGVGGRGARLFRSRSKSAEELVRELSARGDVLYAEPNYIIRASRVPDDPRFDEQWALQNTGRTIGAGAGTPGADIGAAAAWEVSTGSRANVVAVMDTGVDSTHPDLAANMWSAPAAFTVQLGGLTVRCEAGTHGFNAITKTCDPADEFDHGTHVAGILGAAGNNGVGAAGINWEASIMDVKFIDAAGSGTLADALDAIEFVIQAKQVLGSGAGVRVLNASWGWEGEPSQALLDQINRAGASDLLFVAGAGNGGADQIGDSNDVSPFYPASYDAPNVISVAATDNNDSLSSFSNYSATGVHLAAPGVLVYSTIKGGLYDYWSGTSMAAPHVSGAAALLLSRCSLDTAGLKSALLASADPAASLSGKTATGGRLNVGRAMNSCAGPAPTPTSTPAPTPTSTPAPNAAPAVSLINPAGGSLFVNPASVTLSASASDSDGSVTRVAFYAGAQLVGAAYSEPYAVAWGGVAAGRYTLTAVATDERGATTTSAPVSVYVSQPPAGGAGTTGRLARWIDGATGTLGDSVIAENASGNVGVGGSPAAGYRLNIWSPSGTVPFAFTQNAAANTHPTLALFSTLDGPVGQYAGTTHNGAVSFVMGATAGRNFGIFSNNSFSAPQLFINSNGNVGVGTTNPQSSLQVNGYLQLALTPGAPPAADCDAAAEYGRMKVDAAAVKLYICTAAGWKSSALQ